MGEVIRFGKPPRFEGPARCLACKHKWEAESEDYSWLDCPECGTMRGVYDKLWTIPTGTKLWICGCECDQFMVTDKGMFCVGCGYVISHAEICDRWS